MKLCAWLVWTNENAALGVQWMLLCQGHLACPLSCTARLACPFCVCISHQMQSPDEYPLKLGSWKQLPKLQKRAITEARRRGTAVSTAKKALDLKLKVCSHCFKILDHLAIWRCFYESWVIKRACAKNFPRIYPPWKSTLNFLRERLSVRERLRRPNLRACAWSRDCQWENALRCNS